MYIHDIILAHDNPYTLHYNVNNVHPKNVVIAVAYEAGCTSPSLQTVLLIMRTIKRTTRIPGLGSVADDQQIKIPVNKTMYLEQEVN